MITVPCRKMSNRIVSLLDASGYSRRKQIPCMPIVLPTAGD
jgi:hypothetical protein